MMPTREGIVSATLLWQIACLCLFLCISPAAAQDPSEVSEYELQLMEEVSEDFETEDAETVIKKLELILEDDQLRPPVERILRNYLVDLYIESEQIEAAIEQLDFLIAESEAGEQLSLYSLLYQRATLYSELGMDDLAEADWIRVREISAEFDSRISDVYSYYTIREDWQDFVESLFPESYRNSIPFAVKLFLVGIGIWFLVFLFNIWLGNRQRIEGDGTWRQLLLTSAGLAVVQCVPISIAMFFMLLAPQARDLNGVLRTAPLIFLTTLFWCGLYLLPPLRWKGSKEGLPLIEDAEFQDRLNEMASKLRIAPPVARMLPSTGGDMALMAFVGGLSKPSLTITDGILHRLKKEERDAIVGHELGHIANHSLWFFPISVSLGCSAGVIAAYWFDVFMSTMFALAVVSGFRRVVSRYFEYDCDQKAARVAGHAATIKGLQKIHRTHMVGNTGWASLLAYAMATHPSVEERLTALANDAPESEAITIDWSTSAALYRRWTSRFMFILWLGLLTLVCYLPVEGLGGAIRFFTLLGIVLTPSILLQRALRQDVKAEMKRRQVQPQNAKLTLWILVLSFLVVFLGSFAADETSSNIGAIFSSDELWWIVGLTVVLFFVFLGWNLFRAGKSVVAQINLAIHQRRWADAIELGRVNWEKIKKNPAVRHDLLLALWAFGEQDRAIDAMAQLRKEFPKFKHPWLMQALMHLERNEYAEVLELMQDVEKTLKRDISTHGISARCYRLQGQLEEMEQEVDAIEKIMPDAPGVPAFRCALAIDRGDLEQARAFSQQADELSPGDAYIALLRAEVEFHSGDCDAARASLEEARKFIAAMPFAFLGAELRHVEALLNESFKNS